MRRSPLVLTLLLLLPVLGSCATTSAAENPGTVTLEIENDVVPPILVTVYAVRSPANTPRRLIGAVAPASTQRFTFTPEAGTEYRLVAQASGGHQLASNVVTMAEGGLVVWTLSSNIATARD